MSGLVVGPKVTRVPESLEDLMAFLAQFGKPRVGIYGSGGGWHAHVDMHVTSAGTSFEIKSGFSEPSPTAAAKQCAERVLQTLRDLGASS